MKKYIIIILILLPVIALGQEAFDKTFTLEKETYLDSHKRRELNATLKLDSTSLTITAWGTECEFKINNLKQTPIQMYKRNDGNLEWEIILNSKPAQNYIEYSIETKGLKFAYQDTLLDVDTMSYRPDSVIGSYAVYHATRMNNLTRLDGTQEIYNTGKAFHIYRPKAWDSDGDTTWCKLSVDTKTGTMMITVPQKFLDDAVYPVIIDPTVGYITKGESVTFLPQDFTRHCLMANMGGTNGTVDSFALWAQDDGALGDIGWALYSDASEVCISLLDSSTGTVQATEADSLFRMPSAENYTLVAGTDYWISCININNQNTNGVKYDDNAGDSSAAAYEGWPPASSCNTTDGYGGWSISMFIWYTEIEGGPQAGWAGSQDQGTNWTNPSNATGHPDNSCATYDNSGQNILTLYNFGLSVSGTIDSIEATFDGYGTQSQNARREFEAQLTKTGGGANTGVGDLVANVGMVEGANCAAGGLYTVTAQVLWNTTWTAAEINASTFGINIADDDGTAHELGLDAVRITVYTSAAAPATENFRRKKIIQLMNN